MYKYTTEELKKLTIEELNKIGATLEDISKIVYDLQVEYIPELSLDFCLENVEKVLDKREVHHAILTGLAIDELINEGRFPEPIQSIIKHDEGLYGIDEVLALAIVNVYGSIGLTNFGYLDKHKSGIIKEVDNRKRTQGIATTFADDIIAAIAAAAASRMAHSYNTK